MTQTHPPSPTPAWSTGRLVELLPDDCWAELADHVVGRLVWVHAGRPQVVPVNFVVHASSIWVRTAPYSRLATQVDGGRVAFQVDRVDEGRRAGTSVVAHGRCERLAFLSHPPPPELRTWVEGTRSLVLRVVVEDITGRRLLPR